MLRRKNTAVDILYMLVKLPNVSSIMVGCRDWPSLIDINFMALIHSQLIVCRYSIASLSIVRLSC